METFSALLALCEGNSPVTGEFPSQRPVARSFDAFFDLRPNKQLSKTIVMLVIWYAIALIMTLLEWIVATIHYAFSYSAAMITRQCEWDKEWLFF